MENETVGKIVVIGIMLSIIIAIVWGMWSYRHHHNKLREYFDNIKIGDRYFFTVEPSHPFDSSQNHYATIIDKKIVMESIFGFSIAMTMVLYHRMNCMSS